MSVRRPVVAGERWDGRMAALLALGIVAVLLLMFGSPAVLGGASGAVDGRGPPSGALLVGFNGSQGFSLEAPPGVDVEYRLVACNVAGSYISVEVLVARPPEVKAFNISLPSTLGPHNCAPAVVRLRLDARATGSYTVTAAVVSRPMGPSS